MKQVENESKISEQLMSQLIDPDLLNVITSRKSASPEEKPSSSTNPQGNGK